MIEILVYFGIWMSGFIVNMMIIYLGNKYNSENVNLSESISISLFSWAGFIMFILVVLFMALVNTFTNLGEYLNNSKYNKIFKDE